MCDIKKKCVYIFCDNDFCHYGIVKALGCAKKGKGSNLILDMSWSWHHHDDLLWIQQTINIEPN